ncbi:MAG: 5'/3'-nucleotidase SurE [Elusimicrobiota bacterium]
MASKRARILIVNDDGIRGPGLQPLREALAVFAEVTVLVPERERSAQGHTLTLHKPLRIKKHNSGIYTANGSPADCARLGVLKLLRGRADLIASGINAGYNVAQDVVYSGTVAAALEGAIMKIPSFAVSLGSGGSDYREAAGLAVRIARELLRRGLPAGMCLNANVPPLPYGRLRGTEVTRLGERVYDNRITTRKDPLGREYHWLAGKLLPTAARAGTDVGALRRNKASVTPLSLDLTREAFLSRLRAWRL